MQIKTYSQPGRETKSEYYRGVLQRSETTVVPACYVRSGSSSSSTSKSRSRPNPFSYNYEEFEASHGTYTMYDRAYVAEWTGNITTNYGFSCRVGKVPNCIPSSAYNKALSKLYDGIRSGVDLSIDIYQGRQTLDMLKNYGSLFMSPVKTLAKAFGSLSGKGKLRSGTSLISNQWLEWQYGIRPAINTIAELAGDLNKVMYDGDGFLHMKARASNRMSGRLWKGMCGPSNGLIPYTIQTQSLNATEIGISYGISNAELNALSQFSSLNPLSFVYENIPFSFVLDWMVDIGGYLRNLETACMSGLELKHGYVSNLVVVDNTGKALGSIDISGQLNSINLTGRAKSVTFSRSLLSSMPRPEAPTFEPKLGSERLLSAASLLRGFIKS